MNWRGLSCLSLQLVLMVPGMLGQVSTGTIVGSITDPSGGNIEGVSVILTDVRTGLARKVLSGSDGSYVAPNLKPGEYRVTASIAGFNTQTIQGVVLQVDEHARVDIVLQIGEVTQQVTVDATTQIRKEMRTE